MNLELPRDVVEYVRSAFADANHRAVAWYRAEQWARLLEVSSDRAELEDTHDEWVSGAKKRLRNFLLNGVNAVKIDVDVEDLVRWCKERGLKVDGASRATYVADKVRIARRNPGAMRTSRLTGAWNGRLGGFARLAAAHVPIRYTDST